MASTHSREYHFEYWLNGNVKKIKITINNIYDDKFNPSIKYYYESEHLRKEEYYENNILHRDDEKPAIISYYESGITKNQYWYYKSYLHRIHGPAMIKYAPNGAIAEKYWINNIDRIEALTNTNTNINFDIDSSHKEITTRDLTVHIVYYQDYNVDYKFISDSDYILDIPQSKSIYYNNKLHCNTGPAHITYNRNGTKSLEEFYINGHQVGKSIYYDQSGKLII